MDIKIIENYCDGCELHCAFGTHRNWLSWTPEYYPTVKQKQLKTYIDIDDIEQPAASSTRLLAIARARIHVTHCANYQHTK